MKPKISEDIIRRNSIVYAYLAPNEPPIGGYEVLRAVIDLEYNFQRYLLASLRMVNPNIADSELDHGGIFAEPNMLSSLSKCLRLAVLLNLVDRDEAHDIKKLVTIRNMYAHGRHRKQLAQDVDAIAVVRSMTVYNNNKEEVAHLDFGKIFFCCINHIAEIIACKRETLSAAEGSIPSAHTNQSL